MKQTQEYPQGYADAVLAAHERANLEGSMPLSLLDMYEGRGLRLWEDFLDMTPVYVLMRMDPSFIPPGLER